MLYVINWRTRDYSRINAIKKYFGIKRTTLNGESVCDIPGDKEEKFREGATFGFYQITQKPIPEYYYVQEKEESLKRQNVKGRNP